MSDLQDAYTGRTIREYTVIDRIGRGGFADVYRATHNELGHSVAIKMLHENRRATDEFESLFRAEARIIARLNHPYIVPILDYWYDAEEGACLVMRWIAGGTLRTRLNDQPIPLQEFLPYLDMLTQAIDYAHRQGIVHRDIKPSNVLLDDENHAYLADFGIARHISNDPDEERNTGSISGTLAFIAPELIFSYTTPQPASDLYSLAIVTHMCLAGQHPFASHEAQHLHDPLPDLPSPLADAHPALSDVLRKAASHEPGKRHRNVRDFYDEFLKAAHTPTTQRITKPSARLTDTPTVLLSDDTSPAATVPVIGNRSALLIDHPDDVPGLATHFVARDSHRQRVKQALSDGHHVLLCGAGGMGKTTLAAEVISDLLSDDAIKAALWLRTGDSSLNTLVDALLKPLNADAVDNPANQRRHIRQALADASVTHIVLDDVWLDGRDLRRLIDLLPRSVCVLCTSRLRYPIGRLIDVDELAPTDALALLNAQTLSDDTSDAAKALCRLLGYHPLALELAGKVLLVDMLSPSELQQRLTDGLHTLSAPQDYSTGAQNSLQQVIETSLEPLTPQSQKVFFAFGLLDVPTASPEFLALCSGQTTDDIQDQLHYLLRRSLVRRDNAAAVTAYQMHGYSHSYARQQHTLDSATAYSHLPDYIVTRANTLEKLDVDYPNILGLAERAYKNEDHRVFVTIILRLLVDAEYTKTRGYDARLRYLLHQAVDTARNLDMPTALHYLLGKRGDAARDRHQPDKALHDYRESLQLAEKLDLQNRQVILRCVISRILVDRNEIEEAHEILATAQQQAEALDDDSLRGRVLENRGYLAQATDDMAAARDIFGEQLQLVLKTSDIQNQFYAYINYGAANLYLEKYNLADENFQQALSLALSQDSSLLEGYAHHAYSQLYHRTQQRDAAIQALHNALSCFEQSDVLAKIEEIKNFMETHNYPLPEAKARDNDA